MSWFLSLRCPYTVFVKILRNLVKFPAHWKLLLLAPEISRRFFDWLLISHCCYIIWISTETTSTSVKLHVTALRRHFYYFSENVHMSIVKTEKGLYGIRRFSRHIHHQWKWCGTHESDWPDSQQFWTRWVLSPPFSFIFYCGWLKKKNPWKYQYNMSNKQTFEME